MRFGNILKRESRLGRGIKKQERKRARINRKVKLDQIKNGSLAAKYGRQFVKIKPAFMAFKKDDNSQSSENLGYRYHYSSIYLVIEN